MQFFSNREGKAVFFHFLSHREMKCKYYCYYYYFKHIKISKDSILNIFISFTCIKNKAFQILLMSPSLISFPSLHPRGNHCPEVYICHSFSQFYIFTTYVPVKVNIVFTCFKALTSCSDSSTTCFFHSTSFLRYIYIAIYNSTSFVLSCTVLHCMNTEIHHHLFSLFSP